MKKAACQTILLVLAVVSWITAAGPASAATYYVSKDGGSGDGASWATAWNELDQIDWGVLAPGDVISVDGGAGGMVYTTRLEAGAGGTAEGRITIERSLEAGHDGAVTIESGVYVDFPYITIDGKDRDLFVIHSAGGGYVVRVPENGDYFEFKNVYLRTEFQESWGSPFYANSANVLVQGCGFDGTNGEDQIKYNGGGGTLIIEDSIFMGLIHHGDIHEDVVQFDADGINLFARRNIFVSDGTDCFMIDTDAPMGVLEFSYNIFSHVADAIKADSAASLEVFNNVFDSCRDVLISSTPVTIRNSIFTGTSWSGPVHVPGNDTRYCLWDVGTTEPQDGTGNITGDPLFVDEAGLDYHLQAGSPAINAGIDVGLDRDLDGNPIDGAPDIGAYEYYATPPDPRPDQPDEAEPAPDAAQDQDAQEGSADMGPDGQDAYHDPAADDAAGDALEEGEGGEESGCGCRLTG